MEIAHVQFVIQLTMCFNTALNLVFKLNNILWGSFHIGPHRSPSFYFMNEQYSAEWMYHNIFKTLLNTDFILQNIFYQLKTVRDSRLFFIFILYPFAKYLQHCAWCHRESYKFGSLCSLGNYSLIREKRYGDDMEKRERMSWLQFDSLTNFLFFFFLLMALYVVQTAFLLVGCAYMIVCEPDMAYTGSL